jgi:hypothetical protein
MRKRNLFGSHDHHVTTVALMGVNLNQSERKELTTATICSDSSRFQLIISAFSALTWMLQPENSATRFPSPSRQEDLQMALFLNTFNKIQATKV